MNSAIELDSVVKSYRSILAVNNLSFTINIGEIFGLLGPNGAGKTTTINLITGLIRRDSGSVSVLGFDPEKNPRKIYKRIGLVPQETNVYGDLNAIENLRHHAALYCDDLNNIDQNIEATLRLMTLWERRSDPVRTYSGGMKRRLALARTLLHNPDIILFDEPTLGVDVQVRHVLWDHIKSLQSQGKTFIISTNNMEEADRLCERLVIIDQGKAVETGSPEQLKSDLKRDIITLKTKPHITDPNTFLNRWHPCIISDTGDGQIKFEVERAEQIAGDLFMHITKDYHLESIHIARPTLDDVFLFHTGRALRE